MAVAFLAMNEVFGKKFFNVIPDEVYEPAAYAENGMPSNVFVFDLGFRGFWLPVGWVGEVASRMGRGLACGRGGGKRASAALPCRGAAADAALEPTALAH